MLTIEYSGQFKRDIKNFLLFQTKNEKK